MDMRDESNLKKQHGKRAAAGILTSALVLSLFLQACGNSSADTAGILSVGEEAVTETDAPAISLSADGAAEAVKKEETVTVKADALGHPQKTTVEASLQVPEGSGTVIDRTTLKEIRNTGGDEEYMLSNDGELLWENGGETITYEGISSEELPVSVRVSYYLDGKQISPADLAHKSGRVTIRFDYTNRAAQKAAVEGKSAEAPVPFLVLSMVLLPGEHFSNVEVSKGKLIRLGDQTIAVGYALPGVEDTLHLSGYQVTKDLEIPSSVEITADAEDFELEFTETICTNGLFADLDTGKLQDAEDLIDAMEELKEASRKLAEGTGELQDGAQKLQDYLGQYTDGAGEISSNLNTVAGALSTLDEKSSDLQNGSQAVTDGLTALEDGFSGAEARMQEMAAQQEEISAALQQQIQKMAGEMQQQVQGAASAVRQGAQEVGETAQDMEQTAQEMNQAVSELNALIEEINQAAQEAGVDSAVQPVQPVDAERLQEVEKSLAEISSKMPEEMPVPDLETEEMVPSMDLNIDELLASMDSETAGGQQEDFLTQFSQIKNAVTQLKEGSSALTQGIGAYTEGVHKTAQGASALADGASALTQGGAGLKDGYAGMLAGIRGLNEGMQTFDEEGIRELGKLAGKDLENVIDGVKALKESDRSYTSFSGIRDGVEGSVRILIETEEIK